MNQIEKCKVLTFCPGTSTTSATAITTVDTLGCKKAHIYVMSGTQTTTSQTWADISVYHGTNSSGTTLIAAASWATAATTAALNTLPTAALAGIAGSVVEIDLNLMDKGRYLNILTTRGATPTANGNGAILVILEPGVSADTVATKACVNATVGTSAQQVAFVNA